MSFTANEMVTAIANSYANTYVEDRFERAGFAGWLEAEYGFEPETATETLAWLMDGQVMYEGTDVSYLYRDLMEYRQAVADAMAPFYGGK